MSKLVVDLVLQTCPSFPNQWEARLTSGKYLYIRNRNGYCSIREGNSLDQAVRSSDALFTADTGTDDFPYTSLVELTSHLIAWPKSCIPFPGGFEKYYTADVDEGETDESTQQV